MAGMYGCFKGRNSDGAAMASGPPDMTTNQEPAEVQEECSGKKKSKFQTFKKFFARKKRKDPSAAGADAGLKASQSSDNVSKTSENNTLTRSEKEKGSGSKISLGSKALSHDSVFVSDSSEANEALGASQDSIHGKVKSLQLQLKQAIKLGSPPSLMCVKRIEDGGTMSEDDGLPCSPPEYTTHHTVMNQTQRNSSISLEGIDSDDDQLSCAASSRAMSPLVVPGDFSQPASPFVCLDNSAAKHKLGLRHKACNKRKPVRRLEGRPEGNAVVEETLTNSTLETETDALEEGQQRRIEDLIVDQLKPKVETADEEEDEEKQKPQHFRESLLRDKEQRREEEEDESPAEQEVSHGPDTSCTPEPSLSEEEASELRPSSKPRSRASSADSPRATPEPPAASRGHLLDSPGLSNEAEENKNESDLASEAADDDIVQETREEEEESSFLQEVLSSLKTPLVSLEVETEGVVLEMKEEKEDEEMLEEVKEEEVEVDKPVDYQAAPSSSVLLVQTTVEEKEADTPSWQQEEEEEEEEEEVEDEEVEDEVGAVQEEVKGEEEGAEEEEDLIVERFNQHDNAEERQMEEAVEVTSEEEEDMLTRQSVSQAGKQEEEDKSEEEEEEDIELEKQPEVQEKGNDDYEEVEVEMNEGRGAEEAEEAMEEEKEEAEEMTEMIPDAQEVQSAIPVQEEDESIMLGVDTLTNDDDDDIPTELCDQELTLEQKEQENFNQNSDGEEGTEEDVQIELMDQKSDEEEDVEANHPDVDQTEDYQEQDSVERISHLDMKEAEQEPNEATEQAPVSFKPSSLSLPESHDESHSQDSGTTSPSKTSTIHINLVSPSSEKTTSSFQLPPTAADSNESVTESHDSTEPNIIEELADSVGEEDKQSIQEQEATTPASVEETVNQPPCSLDQSKVRFTIAPAWQRSKSLTPPPSPPACDSSFPALPVLQSEEVEAATKEKSVVKPEPANEAKAELVLSPSRLKNTGSTTAKPQNNATPVSVKPQNSTAAIAEESSVVVEGNPDNPFGIRLRKTSALLRFSSEEESTEVSVESPTQPTSCKVESPPISVKPSVSQPISNKPALPKKPDVTGESGAKLKRVSDPAAGRSVSAGSESPSWISVAKQKQKIYKENSLEEITVKKEEQERKSSLPMYVSSAASKEQSNKTAESTGKVSPLEVSKPPASIEKETRRALSPPAPVPPQPSKSQLPPCPVAPKPQLPPNTAKHPPQPPPPQKSPPTPVPVLPKSLSCTIPTSFSKPASPSKTSPVTSPPFLPRTTPEKPSTRSPGPSGQAGTGQTGSSQRGLPPAALPQDEPPWMALAKKKAKAWSEMPQIVQ